MKRYLYRIERVMFTQSGWLAGDAAARDDEILDFVNRMGDEGWRVCSLEIEPRITVSQGGFRVLLEKGWEDDGWTKQQDTEA
jgi:hypothetical protein